MSKMKKPVPLNATIYNNLVKVFNDGSNGIIDGKKWNLKPEQRAKIIEMRKQFPTYQELKDAGVQFVDHYGYIDENGEEICVRSWHGDFDENQTDIKMANILDAKVVYLIAIYPYHNPRLVDNDVTLKIRGVPKNIDQFKGNE